MFLAVSGRASRILQFSILLCLLSGIFLLLHYYPSYSSSAYWGAMMLASFAGWGFMLSRLLRVRNPSLGEQIAWGFSFFLCAGGYLCVFSLAKPFVLAFFVVLGSAVFLFFVIQTKLGSDLPRLPGWSAIIMSFIVALLLLLLYLTALFDYRFQPTDDYVVYLPFATKMQATGTFLEPFSIRRATSYGGQTLLLATFLTVGDLMQANLPDEGLCRIAVLVVLWSFLYTRHKLSFNNMAITAALMALLPDIRLNTTSMFSGTLAFLGLTITCIRSRVVPGESISNGVLIGVTSAAALSLRGTHLLAVAIFWIIDFLSAWKAQPRRSLLQRYAVAVAVFLVSLVGWSITLWRSSGTPMFPVLPGYFNPIWDAFQAKSFQDYAALLVLCLKDRNVQQLFAAGLLAVCIPQVSEEDRIVRLFLLGSWLAFVLHFWPLAFHHGPRHVLRYSYTYLLPSLFYLLSRAVLHLETPSPRPVHIRTVAAFSLVAGSLLLFCTEASAFWSQLKMMDKQRHLWAYSPMEPAYISGPYVRLQRIVPEGEPLLSILEENHRLNFQRNPISLLDMLGAFSPPPGMRSDQTAPELVDYFKALNYRWLAAVRPENGFTTYATDYWEKRAEINRSVRTFESLTVIHEMQQFLGLVSTIESSCRLAYDHQSLTLIDLNDCNFALQEGLANSAGGSAVVR